MPHFGEIPGLQARGRVPDGVQSHTMAASCAASALMPRLPRSDHVPHLPIVHHGLIHTLVTSAGRIRPSMETRHGASPTVRDEPRQKRPPISWSIASTVLLAAAAVALAGAAPAVRGAQARSQSRPIAISRPGATSRAGPAEAAEPAESSPVALEAKTKLVEFENAPFPFDSGDTIRASAAPPRSRTSATATRASCCTSRKASTSASPA